MSQFTCSNYPMSCLCGPNRLMNKGGEKREREREEDRVNNRQEAEGREKKAQYCIQFTLTNPIPKRALRLRLGQAWCNNDTLQLQLQLQQQNGSNFAQTKDMGKPRELRERGREGGTHAHTYVSLMNTYLNQSVCLTVCTCGLSNVRIFSWAKYRSCLIMNDMWVTRKCM